MVDALVAARLDLLHLHGIWQYPVRAAGRWAAQTGKPLVISPHGMLDPWITSRGKWKKALARLLWERRSWARAQLFHALTDDEAADIRSEVPGARTATVPNAAPPLSAARTAPAAARFLYLGRIHPKKNVGALVEAWWQAEALLPDTAELIIAGWGDDDHVETLKALLKMRSSRISFAGPVFGAAKEALLRDSHALVLPSSSEGLPMVVLEAWSAGLPVLMSEHCHLPEGFAAGAAVQVGTDPDSLSRELARAAGWTAEDWQAKSRAGRALADGPFAARAVAARWESAYSGLMETQV